VMGVPPQVGLVAVSREPKAIHPQPVIGPTAAPALNVTVLPPPETAPPEPPVAPPPVPAGPVAEPPPPLPPLLLGPPSSLLLEQAPPNAVWGTSYVAITFAARTSGDYLRILARDDNTQVFFNGVTATTLAAGTFFESLINMHILLQASKPVLVAHFMASYSEDSTTGDPLMDYLIPTDQWAPTALFVTAQANKPYTQWFANIAVPAGAESGVLLDGIAVPAARFKPAGTGFSGGSPRRVLPPRVK